MDLIFKIFIYSWLISIFFGIIVAISYPLFRDYADSKFEVFMPLYNLFGLCSFNGYDEKFGLLFLLPIINIIFMMFMCYKLKDKYTLSASFILGLVLLPIVFMPILAYSKKYTDNSDSYESYTYENAKAQEKEEDIEVFVEEPKVEKKTNKRVKKIEEPVKEEVKEEEPEIFDENALTDDDSIFKLQPKSHESVNNKPYKARRVRVNEQFINSGPAEREKIDKVEKWWN